VAVAAIYAVVADVMFMAELHGLLALYVLPRVVGGTIDFGQHPHGRQEYEDGSENAQLGKKICAVMKNLGHNQRLSSLSFSR
jgi:hypothetical protein